jgi:hypothetical protein
VFLKMVIKLCVPKKDISCLRKWAVSQDGICSIEFTVECRLSDECFFYRFVHK